MKKLLSLTLVLALLLAFVPTVYAEGDDLILVGGDDYINEEYTGELPDVDYQDIMPVNLDLIATPYSPLDPALTAVIADAAAWYVSQKHEQETFTTWEYITAALVRTAYTGTDADDTLVALPTLDAPALAEWMYNFTINEEWSPAALSLLLARLTAPEQAGYIDIIGQVIAAAQTEDGSWYAYGGPDLSTTIYAVRALGTHVDFNREAAAAWFASVQLEDGGFTFFGETGDVDMTAMVLPALVLLPGTEEIMSAAVEFILSQMTENCGFVSVWSEAGEENANTVASVISGFVSAGVEIDDETMQALYDNLLSFVREDGGFAYEVSDVESNVLATTQALTALCEKALGCGFAAIEKPATEYRSDMLHTGIALAHLMIGDNHGFRGEDRVTNAELATVMMRYAPLGGESADEYDDIPENAWYAPQMRFIRDNGLMLDLAPSAYADRSTVYEALNAFCRTDLPTDSAALMRMAPVTRDELAIRMLLIVFGL